LIDEVDRIDVEIEALFLEILSDYQVTIPELGTLKATNTPLVFLTSNDTRDLSEALKRRCLYLHLDYPSGEREKAIVKSHLPDMDEYLVSEIVRFVGLLREMDLEKPPSVSESLDYASALMILAARHITDDVARDAINVLLKYNSDILKVQAFMANKESNNFLS
jgi:MoxR-like ATPase